MSGESRPPSPPLPTFAIKDLCGPLNPPALISISKRRYDATLKSTPGAALLYLDDDDGELITVGSSFELDQRLEEPVPKYIRELKNPADGKLVHVFDINHSAANLAEWRDHEAYTSKRLNCFTSPPQSPVIDSLPSSKCPITPCEYHMKTVHVPKSRESPEPDTEDLMTSYKTETTTIEKKEMPEVSFNFLDGIEEHLSGLANVLQIASDTLRKAAEKTHEADTSVVEDILKGVKGILTEVGSFGADAFKTLSAEITSDATDQWSTQGASEASVIDEKEAAARDFDDAEDTTNDTEASQSSDETLQASVYYNVETAPSDHTITKVKYMPLQVSEAESDDATTPQPLPPRAPSARPEDSCKVNFIPSTISIKPQSVSILDDSSEDAEFTARYPPLSSIRRVRSTVERPVGWSTDSDARLKHREIQQRADERSLEAVRRANATTFSPFAPPPSMLARNTGVSGRLSAEDKTDKTEAVQKPLPGAWPDVKNDAAPAPAMPRESSGDFFNRMVGRGRSERSKGFTSDYGLSRANTTASSNPASRLNGPFDPGFPYDSSQGSRRLNHLPPYRPYRRSASPRRQSPVRPSKHDKFATPDVPKYPVPWYPRGARARCVELRRSEATESLRHHRSVPQLRESPSLPYQIMKSKPVGKDVIRPLQRSTTDFLAGPTPMPMQPPMPFTAQPTFAPRPVAPGLWAPWQSSPPTQAPADEASNVSTLQEFPTRTSADSPVSPQSVTIRDFEFPSNTPPFPSAQPQGQSSSTTPRDSAPSRPSAPPSHFGISRHPPPSLPAPPHFAPQDFAAPSMQAPRPPPPPKCLRVEPVKDKIDECVQTLKMCGFGLNDENLKDRLHVYAVAADGDVIEAVEMIEEDRRMTAPGRFH